MIGSKASQLLQKILQPVKSFPQNNMDMKESLIDETQDEAKLNIFDFENKDCTPSSIISLVISDPRISTGKDEDQTSVKNQENILGPANGESTNLWRAASGIYPPVEESVLCTEKHHQRSAFYCLNEKRPSILNESAKQHYSRVCPVLLLKNNSPKNSFVRWSIILPISWVKTFWIPLVSLGGRAIGLREKHWIACEVGLPYFPSDFPGCTAYSCFMATEAAASLRNAELRPPSVRPLSVPTSPPWDVVHYTFNKKKITGLDNQTFPNRLSFENMNLATNSPEDFHRAPCCNNGVSFHGLIPRSSRLLGRFLSGINNCQLHIYPSMPERQSCISRIMKDKDISKQGLDDAFLENYDHKLCFIRILLHSYKDGVFEDGAVVCSPHLSDLAFMTSRSDSDKFELHIPDSHLRSYFVQQPSGKWDLQEPSDPVGKESHRWPIGFVTTGFVHGSKKPVAGALCEAVLLACLREEQWNAVPAKRRKKDIYVLVRNLRSTAYRLALAEIVLEQSEQDLEYM